MTNFGLGKIDVRGSELVLVSASGGLEAYLNRDGFNISIWRTRSISKQKQKYNKFLLCLKEL